MFAMKTFDQFFTVKFFEKPLVLSFHQFVNKFILVILLLFKQTQGGPNKLAGRGETTTLNQAVDEIIVVIS